jgi:hypothetical protein
MPPQQFRYLNDRKEQLSASLGQVVDVDSNPLFTIFDNTGTHIGNSEWLTYFGTDGGVWTTRCVAGYMGGSENYSLSWESQNADGNGDNATFPS